MASDNITRTLMYKDIPICEVIFKNGYFYKIKKILNQDLLPTKYFNCNTALALARWFSIRDLCYLRTEFTHNKSAEEFDLISNNWMFASPFDNYWLSSPDNNYNWHMVNNLPLNVLSFNLPKNAFYYKITDNNIIYREPYSANNVSARKFTTYTSKTIIDKNMARCFIQVSFPKAPYFLLPISDNMSLTDVSILENMLNITITDQILNYLLYDSFNFIYFNEFDNSILFI